MCARAFSEPRRRADMGTTEPNRDLSRDASRLVVGGAGGDSTGGGTAGLSAPGGESRGAGRRMGMHQMPAQVSSVTRALGPGDADPRTPDAGAMPPVESPAKPGDGEPHVRAMPPVQAPARPGDGESTGVMPALQGPAKPGDGEPDEYIVRPPRCLGPGDQQVPQPAQRVKRKV